jgi:hypothetical protein
MRFQLIVLPGWLLFTKDKSLNLYFKGNFTSPQILTAMLFEGGEIIDKPGQVLHITGFK